MYMVVKLIFLYSESPIAHWKVWHRYCTFGLYLSSLRKAHLGFSPLKRSQTASLSCTEAPQRSMRLSNWPWTLFNELLVPMCPPQRTFTANTAHKGLNSSSKTHLTLTTYGLPSCHQTDTTEYWLLHHQAQRQLPWGHEKCWTPAYRDQNFISLLWSGPVAVATLLLISSFIWFLTKYHLIYV